MANEPRRTVSVYFYLALGAWLGAAILLGAYLGMCQNLVTDVLPEEQGGKGQVGALIFMVILAVFGYYAWRKRYRPMR